MSKDFFLDNTGPEVQERLNQVLENKDAIESFSRINISEDGYWMIDGVKTEFKAQGRDGRDLQIRVSKDGQNIEVSVDGVEWYTAIKNFNKLRILGYVDNVSKLPVSANVGDMYGVWNEDAEEGSAYEIHVNTVVEWVLDAVITKVYSYDTELPSTAKNGSTVLVPVTYLTLNKQKIDGYKAYRFDEDDKGWVMLLNTAEIYASDKDIVSHGDNAYAIVQGDSKDTYQLYKRVCSWVPFGNNSSITYQLVQDINEADENNILSGKATKDAIDKVVESTVYLTEAEYDKLVASGNVNPDVEYNVYEEEE